MNSTLAWELIAAADRASEAENLASSIAVVDAGGHLVAFLRRSGALLASVEVAQVKAKTAVFFGVETKHLPFDQPFTPALLGAVSTPLAFVPGGVPIRSNGVVIGAIGIGGGNANQDAGIAEKASAAVLVP